VCARAFAWVYPRVPGNSSVGMHCVRACVHACERASVPWTCILTVRGSSRVLGQVGAAAAAPARRRPAGTGAAPGAKAAATAHVQVRQWGSMHCQGTQCGSPMLPPGRPITPIMSVCQHCACARWLELPRTALHAPALVQVVASATTCTRWCRW
jgi:hypothetical protein